MWQLAKSYMPYLSKPFQEAADLYRKSLTSAQKPLERWEFCEVTAERFFGHLMTSMYTKSRQFEQVIAVAHLREVFNPGFHAHGKICKCLPSAFNTDTMFLPSPLLKNCTLVLI
jgi:hypothetical protein